MALSAQRQFLVSISGINGYFMTKSGGEVSSESTKVFEGGAKTPEIITNCLRRCCISSYCRA